MSDALHVVADLRRWLGKHGAEAVVVRPDRYMFGTGDAAALLEAWSEAHRP